MTRPRVLNLTTTFTVKSNALRNLRKAIAAGECDTGAFRVAPLGGGFRIVKAVGPELADAWTPAAETPAGDTVAKDAAKMTEALAESRDAYVSPGLARLRASDQAESVRAAVQADSAQALSKASIERTKQEHAVQPRRVERAIAKLAAPKAVPEAAQQKAAVSPDALKVLTALFYSPALREIAPEAKAGVWVDYKTINESDRPHGFAGRQVSGLVAGLQRRGLVECRADGSNKFSTRLTGAGASLAMEAGR